MKKSKTSRPKTLQPETENNSAINNEAAVSNKPDNFLIVGIGASAGGIQALKVFFENVPADSGAAYVVILHLSPDHESQLANVLQTVALIPVTQVTERMRVEPNHVYVVPPNKSLSMADEHIVLAPVQTVEERRAPVDIFFRTLAETHGERNVAVVLSGTGADGSMGIKRVKENGGAAFVQNPREAEFSEMPRSSIATDLIDLILNVSEIPAQIIAFRDNPGKIEIPEEAEKKSKAEKQQRHPHEQALTSIFTQLRVRTGHDFTNYKRATMLRRIERRINVRGLPDITAYAAYLRENGDEAHALLKDLLISVTNFFRDKATFLYLEKEILPKISDGKNSDDPVRVWVAGCATGEEAYSLAMFLAEQTGSADGAPTIQIFATDIDQAAVAKAREGFYTLNDAADVSPERLKRFFTRETGGYRIRRELRDLILFAHHNVMKDPPFSRLDLITCRNMLIYLNASAQDRVMETFHFSLNTGGYLFLGNSETVDGTSGLYAPVSREHRVYQSRRTAPRIGYPVPEISGQLARFIEPNGSEQPPENAEPSGARPLEKVSYADLHQQLLEEYTPSVVVSEEYDIVHMSESSLRFMQMTGGEPTQNLLKLIRPDLRIELRTALYQAAQRRTNVEVKNVKIKTGDREESVNISVRPVMRQTDTARGFILVLFESVQQNLGDDETVYRSEEPVARQLEEELIRSKAQLRSSVEQYEVQAEEFNASNEELQALNEELRSSAEELETGKEELQSLNEELGTVNQELKIKIEEISQTSNNLSNLINSTDIGTIFLDRLFRVDLFTPAAARIFNLIPADIGRPLADIAHQLEKTNLLKDARLVLEKLQTVEREVRSLEDRDFMLRILPYRTKDDKIGGVVITFYDITKRKRAEIAKAFLASIVESSEDSMLTINFNRVITSWNRSAEILYGYTAAEVVGKPLTMLTPPDDFNQVLSNVDKIKHSQQVEVFETVRMNKDGRELNLEVVLSPVKDDTGAVIGVSTIARDVTERRQAEKALRESEEKYRTLFDSIDQGFCLLEVLFDADAKPFDYRFVEINEAFEQQSGLVNAVGKTILELVPNLEPQWIEQYGKVARSGEAIRFEADVVSMNYIFDIYAFPSGALSRNLVAVLFADITERKRTEANLAFLAETSADFAPLFRAEEIMQRVGSRLAAHLNLSCCNFSIADEEADRIECLYAWRRDDSMPDVSGAHKITTFLSEEGRRHYAAGKFSVINDMRNNPLLNPAMFELSDEPGLRSVVDVPYLKNGRWKFLLTAARSEAGEWRADEVELIRELAKRIYIRIERARAEGALREFETRLRLLVESAADYAIFTMTTDSVIDSWNLGAEKVFGWTESEVIGQPSAFIFTPEDRAQNAPEQEIEMALQMGSAPDERFHLRKDGSRFYVSGMMTLLKDPDGRVRGFVKIARDMTEQIEAERAVRDREMLQRLVAAQEDERKRIARDLHDELGQQLTALRLKLDAARKMCGDGELRGKIDEMELIAKSIDNGVDFLAWELRPAALDHLGLIVALENYVKQWSHHSGVTVELRASNLKRDRFPSEIETNLYRIVQEALNNTHKHAGAKSVEVVLEKRDGLIALLVADDGAGFDPKNKKNLLRGLGLTGMKERAALIGGTLEIESAPGQGTTVFVRVPASTLKRRNIDAE